MNQRVALQDKEGTVGDDEPKSRSSRQGRYSGRRWTKESLFTTRKRLLLKDQRWEDPFPPPKLRPFVGLCCSTCTPSSRPQCEEETVCNEVLVKKSKVKPDPTFTFFKSRQGLEKQKEREELRRDMVPKDGLKLFNSLVTKAAKSLNVRNILLVDALSYQNGFLTRKLCHLATVWGLKKHEYPQVSPVWTMRHSGVTVDYATLRGVTVDYATLGGNSGLCDTQGGNSGLCDTRG
uniref:Uncharacterized protein n=1 Tax=Timema shepardi TaxID=629360 RepID=A0A7R9FYZ3_TIMSH|nr:unnamed protein product [Timema shepardi]